MSSNLVPALAWASLALTCAPSLAADTCEAARDRVVAGTGAKVIADTVVGVAFSHPDAAALSLLCGRGLFGVGSTAAGPDPADAWYEVVGRSAKAAIPAVGSATVAEAARRCVDDGAASGVGGAEVRAGTATVICHVGGGAAPSLTVTRR